MKSKRQEKILEIIGSRAVETQEELADILNAEGFAVTQATVSRDIRELKLIKTGDDKNKQKYTLIQDSAKGAAEPKDRYIRVLREGFVSMDKAQNILVIKTVSGMAMAVAAALDALEFEAIVGSIAGDDTIMCAVRSEELTDKVMSELTKVLYR